MTGRILAIVLALLCALTSAAQDRTDVIVMKNGDRITCEIVSLSDGVLSVKLDYVDGSVALQWSKVARIESTRLFIVKTENGTVHTGTLSTLDSGGGQPLTIEVAKAPGDRVGLDAQKVVNIESTASRFWSRFNGDVNLGVSYSKGNQAAQYNLNSLIEYPRDRWAVKATLGSSLSSSSGSSSSKRNDLTIRLMRMLRWNKFFYAGQAGFLQSSEQGISLQSNLSGGIGYHFKNSNRLRFSVLAGAGWQRTRYNGTASPTTQNAAAGFLSTELRFFKFKKTTFGLEATLLPSISEPGRFHFRLNQSYYLKIVSDLSWNISFYGDWDSRPPRGFSGSDYGTSTGIGWTFGNK